MTDIRRLFWEEWNEEHIALHAVTRDEVEEACHGDFIVGEAYGGRIMLVGPTQAGRMLSVILAPRGRGVYYPVTARPASRKERELYQTQQGDAAND
jgi:uncharacterized DUF497 family protein